MEFGKVEYVVLEEKGEEKSARSLKLTLIGQGDEDVLREEGLAVLRRRRIIRLTSEAMRQGGMLGYRDLSGLLFTSLATIKRDVRDIESEGITVPIRGRRKNGNGTKKQPDVLGNNGG